MDAEIERDDVKAIMLSLMYLNWKADRVLDILESDGEEEEEAEP